MQQILNIITTFLAYFSGQAPRCEHYQDVSIGETYYVYSQNYPSSYKPGIKCRWIATCPENYNCQLNCSEILLPSSPQCSTDKLLLSASGDVEMRDADVYCGNESTVIISEGRTISAGLDVSRTSPGGKFLCQLTAVPETKLNNTCSCGYKKRNRIVGGNETEVNEYPMMAGIMNRFTKNIFCGAVIIDKRYLLTAAHCLNNENKSETFVLVGEQDYTLADSPATAGYGIAEYIIHPDYNKSNPLSDCDIAIIKTTEDMKFGDKVGPVCLPIKLKNDRYNFTGDVVTALGWGNLDFGGPTTDTLHKVDLNVISDEACGEQGVEAEIKSSLTRMCTYTPGKDTCQGDSGGPLLYTDPSSGVLYNVGVASYGQFCGSKTPVVNTRVTAFLDWIRSQTPEAKYCEK